MDSPTVPIVDWRFLQEVNLWQVLIAFIALYIVVRILIRFWPALKTAIALIEALGGLPTFMAETKTTLDTQSDTLAVLEHEVLPNSGGSLRDAVDKHGETLDSVVSELVDVNLKLAADKERLDELEELEHTQPREKGTPS